VKWSSTKKAPIRKLWWVKWLSCCYYGIGKYGKHNPLCEVCKFTRVAHSIVIPERSCTFLSLYAKHAQHKYHNKYKFCVCVWGGGGGGGVFGWWMQARKPVCMYNSFLQILLHTLSLPYFVTHARDARKNAGDFSCKVFVTAIQLVINFRETPQQYWTDGQT